MTSPVLVTISYSIRPEKHDEFLRTMGAVSERINQAGVKLSVYRAEGEANSYVELYECDSIDAFDSLEDNLDDATRDNLAKIASEYTTSRQSVKTMKRAF